MSESRAPAGALEPFRRIPLSQMLAVLIALAVIALLLTGCVMVVRDPPAPPGGGA